MIKLSGPRFQAKILSVSRLDNDIYEIRLTPPEVTLGEGEFYYVAGQYCGLGLVNDVGHMRPFSIAGAPDQGYLEFHIRDNGHGLSATLCDVKQIGLPVYLTQAAGDVHLVGDATRDIVMFAGGTGYAPMRAILQSLVAQGFNHNIDVFIGGRDLGALYMFEELLNLSRALPQLSAYFCADDVSDQRNDLKANVYHGNLRALAQRHVKEGLQDKRIYISGPPAMVIDIQGFALDNNAHKDFMHLDEENIAAYVKQYKENKK
jgi:NAD(P)H-flavin reductase